MVEAMATPCLVWRGGVQSKGYGATTNGRGGTMLAHRAAWEQEHGPIADGLTVDHLCGNKLCVNTEHMELVTPGENLAPVVLLAALLVSLAVWALLVAAIVAAT